jgi:hypothetical protein
MAFWFGT